MSDEIEILVQGRDEIPDDLKEEKVDPEKQKLIDELEAARKEREQLAQKASSNEGLASEFGRLTDVIINQQKEREIPEQTPVQPLDPAEFDKQFFKKGPAKGMEEFIQKKLAPELQQVLGSQTQLLRDQQKRLTMLDESTRDVMKKYGSEVEEIVNSMAPNEQLKPSAWKNACRLVKADHLEELFAEMQKVKEEEKTKPSNGVPMSASTVNSPTPAVKRRKVLTPEEIEDAAKDGLDPKIYAKTKYNMWEE